MKFFIVYSILIALVASNILQAQETKISPQAHHTKDGFRNPYPGFEDRGFLDVMKWMFWDRLFKKDSTNRVADSLHFEVVPNNGSWLRQNKDSVSVTWIGHSTLLVQIGGLNILTDPIWSDRCSPFSFAGPKRMEPPGLEFDKLPPIDVVIISHNHYDHLDKTTIKRLGNNIFYLVPLGIGDFLEDLDITNYQELDWWDDITFNGVKFVCTPTQHFSGRTLFDRNKTLWCSWVVKAVECSFYFAGDTGYFPGFKEIGNRYGPFDIAAIPIGAYKPRWFMGPVHINPVEAVNLYTDVHAKYFIPIHWGTFKLSDEPLDEPPELLMQEVAKRNLDPSLFHVLKHGETFKPGIISGANGSRINAQQHPQNTTK